MSIQVSGPHLTQLECVSPALMWMIADITEPEGMRVLKKKDDLELFGGVRPKVGKKKKDRKKSVASYNYL